MKRVYIAGSYSADNVLDVLHNIGIGISVCSKILQMGYAPFCPWLDYQFVFFDEKRSLKVSDFYRYSLSWLSVSDILYVLPEYENSKGTLKEIEFAEKNNIPVCYNLDNFPFN